MRNDDNIFTLRLAYLSCGSYEYGISYKVWLEQLHYLFMWLSLDTSLLYDPNPEWSWVGEGLENEYANNNEDSGEEDIDDMLDIN